MALHAWIREIWGRSWRLISLACCFMAVFMRCSPSCGGDAIATGARVGGDETRTRFVADLT